MFNLGNFATIYFLSDYDAKAANQYSTRVMKAVVDKDFSCDSDRGDELLKNMLNKRNFSKKDLKAIAKRKQELLKPC